MQLSNAVRQAIRLECRIVAGHAATLATPADPRAANLRRARIRRAIRQATQGHSDRAKLCAEADDMLDVELALDPDGTIALPDLLETICDDLGFELDYEKLAADLAILQTTCTTNADAADHPDWPDPAAPLRPH